MVRFSYEGQSSRDKGMPGDDRRQEADNHHRREQEAPRTATADVFESFVDHNVGAHKPDRIVEKIRGAGAHVIFLPPYSPDLNPIEPCWGKLKGTLKSIGATTRRTLDDAIAHGMSLITPQDAAAWFRHCGYGGQPTRSPL